MIEQKASQPFSVFARLQSRELLQEPVGKRGRRKSFGLGSWLLSMMVSSDATSSLSRPTLRILDQIYCDENQRGVGICEISDTRIAFTMGKVLLDSPMHYYPPRLSVQISVGRIIREGPNAQNIGVRTFEGADNGRCVTESTIIDGFCFFKGTDLLFEYHSVTDCSCLIEHLFSNQ